MRYCDIECAIGEAEGLLQSLYAALHDRGQGHMVHGPYERITEEVRP